MTDLKDYLPDEIIFKLPTTVKFPEVIFPDCICMDDVKKKLSEHFVTIQEKDVIANRVMDEYEISIIRANYGEIAEEQIPELESQFESLKAKYPEIIDDVRGVGLMLAVEFVTSDIGYSIAKGLFSRGVMTAGTLVNSKCIRFEPTAVITEEQIAAVIERMDAALADTKKEYNL